MSNLVEQIITGDVIDAEKTFTESMIALKSDLTEQIRPTVYASVFGAEEPLSEEEVATIMEISKAKAQDYAVKATKDWAGRDKTRSGKTADYLDKKASNRQKGMANVGKKLVGMANVNVKEDLIAMVSDLSEEEVSEFLAMVDEMVSESDKDTRYRRRAKMDFDKKASEKKAAKPKGTDEEDH